MENAGHDKPTPLRKRDSTIVLEHFDSFSSSCAYLRQESVPRSTRDVDDDKIYGMECSPPPSASIGLDVSIRFGRIGLLMVLAVSALVAFTITFNRGVVLGHFDPAAMDANAQKRLIDDYNSYTGNVASVFGRPVEIFVALAVHLMLLRVIASSLLRTEVSWKADAFTLAITAGVGFLISNGLNSLNVQPQSPEIKTFISAVDLAFESDSSTSAAAWRSSNLTQTFSERSAKNPITNTVLRNLVMPRVSSEKPNCSEAIIFDYSFPDVGLEFGFPQRDWQSRLLQEAIDPKQLRVVVNPSNTTGNQPVNASDLPMNASVAANLYAHSMFIMPFYFHWANLSDIVDLENLPVSFDSVAHYLDLVPPATPMRDETEDREWFLRESMKALSKSVNGSDNISRSDVIMEFSHVDITSTVRFDALTIEFEVDEATEYRSKDSSARYSNLAMTPQCGPWPMRCMMLVPEALTMYDLPAQVQVFGVCVSPNGTEELSFAEGDSIVFEGQLLRNMNYLHCAATSNTSLMVMSIGKRFVAESVTQNKTVNASGYFDDPWGGSAVVTNLHRIYTFTIAKLSWELVDLSVAFNAECANDTGSCEGLRFPLAPAAANSSQNQELIVGVSVMMTVIMDAPRLCPTASAAQDAASRAPQQAPPGQPVNHTKDTHKLKQHENHTSR